MTLLTGAIETRCKVRRVKAPGHLVTMATAMQGSAINTVTGIRLWLQLPLPFCRQLPHLLFFV